MDEPFAAVDAYTRVNLQSEVKTLMSGLRTTTIFVTHDVNEALFLGRQVIVMSGRPGRIIREIRPDQAIGDTSGTSIAQMSDEIYALLRSAGAPAESFER
jgi:ABC-type nitrate/sulfonate/bicarbonate transport system ATPase subunit